MLNQKLVRIPRQNLNTVINSLPFQLQKDLRLPKLSKIVSRTPRLDLNQTQIVQLPEIFRYRTPSPHKETPSTKHFSYERSVSSERQLVNLENIIFQEEKLQKILELLSKDNNDIHKALFEY